jgi:hypothetical protein
MRISRILGLAWLMAGLVQPVAAAKRGEVRSGAPALTSGATSQLELLRRDAADALARGDEARGLRNHFLLFVIANLRVETDAGGIDWPAVQEGVCGVLGVKPPRVAIPPHVQAGATDVDDGRRFDQVIDQRFAARIEDLHLESTASDARVREAVAKLLDRLTLYPLMSEVPCALTHPRAIARMRAVLHAPTSDVEVLRRQFHLWSLLLLSGFDLRLPNRTIGHGFYEDCIEAARRLLAADPSPSNAWRVRQMLYAVFAVNRGLPNFSRICCAFIRMDCDACSATKWPPNFE